MNRTVLSCARRIEESTRSAPEISTRAMIEANQLGKANRPMRWRAISRITSEVSEKRMIATASEISRKRACTSMNSTTAKAMITKAVVRTRASLSVSPKPRASLSSSRVPMFPCIGPRPLWAARRADTTRQSPA